MQSKDLVKLNQESTFPEKALRTLLGRICKWCLIPPEKKRKRELEFKHFEQKGMSVVTYFVNFISSERFASGLVATEKIQADRFFEALIYTRILNSNVSVLCTSQNLIYSDMHVANRA